ncbi:hypothetical protein [Methanobacterium paludis]|uniref:Uncharacterized protein n=1 Tax=Methanobacterium paludis (strain DSM 25820 / JCM 18151 / SWAN1) TaxID=868131 RepID=F6D4J0_METPW|nr:hypothetical protein [Methanobacterium paludis]AEG19230.1 hypothetical protein MSWAN_2222 [Methanobacterium paludis]
MAKVKQSEEDLKSQLKDQIQLLLNSCQLFDEGFKIEAKNIALRIRVLLHDARSHSLLTQLGKKDILFYDTSLDYDSRNPFPYMGLIKIMKRPKGDEFFAPLDEDSSRYLNGKITFSKWWNELIVLEDSNKNPFTRKNLILTVSNKDGGAHVDSELNEEYVNLTRNESIGWMYANNAGEGYIMGAELTTIRQIAHEVLKSLKDEFPEIFESAFNIPPPKIKNSAKEDEMIIEPLKVIVYEGEAESKEYKQKMDFNGSETEINIDSLVFYLEASITVDYWTNFIESLGIKVGLAGMVYKEIQMLKKVNIKTIGELDNLLQKSKGWGEKYLNGVYINICWDVSRERLSTDRSGILKYFLIANFPDIFTDDILERELGHGNPEYFTVPAKLYNPNYQT